MIKVSVIIPVYNVEKYLEECLDSIINQTLQEIEILCVNDGSTDNSGTILKEYQKKDSRIFVYEKANGGQSSARNIGIQNAVGKYIYFMDSDDYLELEALEILYSESERLHLDVLYFSGNPFWESVELKETHFHLQNLYSRGEMVKSVLTGIDMLQEMCKVKKYLVSPCLQFINRSYLSEKNISFCEGIIHEDNLFSFLVIVQAKRTFCFDRTFFNRRIRENSTMTNTEDVKNARGYYICLKQVCNYIEQHSFTYENERALTSIVGGLINNFTRIYNSIPKSEEWKITDKESPMEVYLFQIFIRKYAEYESLKNEYNSLKMDCNLILNSRSFKIGRAITYFPRKIRGVIWLLKNKGIRYTISRIILKVRRLA